jgi:hypothetical protein
MPGFGLLVLIFLFGFSLFGVGSGTTTSSTLSASTVFAVAPAGGAPVTQAMNGRTLRLRPGDARTLRLSHRWHWSKPQVSGAAIRLVRVEYIRDPGYDEWTILTAAKGTATIRATGRPGSRRFRLIVRVN